MDVFKKFLDKIFGVKNSNKHEKSVGQDVKNLNSEVKPLVKQNVDLKQNTFVKKEEVIKKDNIEKKPEVNKVKKQAVEKKAEVKAKKEKVVENKAEIKEEVSKKPEEKTKPKQVNKKAKAKKIDVVWEGEPEEIEFTYMLKEKRTRVVVLAKKIEKISATKYCIKGFCKNTRNNKEFLSNEVLTKIVVQGVKNRVTVKELVEILQEEVMA